MHPEYDGWFVAADYPSSQGMIRKARGEHMTVVRDGRTTVYLRQVGNPEETFEFYVNDSAGQDADTWGSTRRTFAWNESQEEWVGDVIRDRLTREGRVETYQDFTVRRDVTAPETDAAGMVWDWDVIQVRDPRSPLTPGHH